MKFVIAIIKPFKLDEVREGADRHRHRRHDRDGGSGFVASAARPKSIAGRIHHQHGAQAETGDRL